MLYAKPTAFRLESRIDIAICCGTWTVNGETIWVGRSLMSCPEVCVKDTGVNCGAGTGLPIELAG
jgi:hypothetical protein